MPNKPKRDHTQLICDIGELSGLFTKSFSLESFLQTTAEMISTHMDTEVCSIYLYHDEKEELVLRATKGLNKEFIGHLRLKSGEGLTGLAVKELRTICERQASRTKNFRYFPGLGEDRFESFLVVPILRGLNRVGAIVVQNTKKDYFHDEDIRTLRAITVQLANTIEMARLILSIEEKQDVSRTVAFPKNLGLVKGKTGSPGFAVGEIVFVQSSKDLLKSISPYLGQKFTLNDFHQAVHKTEKQIQNLQKEIEEKLSDVASLIFTAQILMLKDNNFIDAIVDLIKRGLNPPLAVIQVVDDYVKKFEVVSNMYIQEKSFDIRDVGWNLLNNLLGITHDHFIYEDRVVIAQELLPSDILKLSSQKVRGVILLSGGVTSHLSILAQSLQIPLIIADVQGLLSLAENTQVIVDADQGNIYIKPNKEVLKSFKEKEEARLEALNASSMSARTFSKDKVKVKLLANINLLSDIKNAKAFKAEGVGLYRTEFPFIVRDNFPSEEEQYIIYKKLVDGMIGLEITFRTLDIGGDKLLSYFDHHSNEKNPSLGLRSIRFSLQHKDIFVQQIRAVLRAGAQADIRIMFPMISSLDEFIEAKKIVLQCIEDLKKEKILCISKLPIGLMIELPSMLEIIDELAEEADFFSIGTNDFVQYMLAVDRTNERVADLYQPFHPSILRGLKRIVKAGIKNKIDISVCGDMVHDANFVKFLLGIGIRTLSLNPVYLKHIQKVILELNVKEARQWSDQLLKESRLSRLMDLVK